MRTGFRVHGGDGITGNIDFELVKLLGILHIFVTKGFVYEEEDFIDVDIGS